MTCFFACHLNLSSCSRCELLPGFLELVHRPRDVGLFLLGCAFSLSAGFLDRGIHLALLLLDHFATCGRSVPVLLAGDEVFRLLHRLAQFQLVGAHTLGALGESAGDLAVLELEFAIPALELLLHRLVLGHERLFFRAVAYISEVCLGLLCV